VKNDLAFKLGVLTAAVMKKNYVFLDVTPGYKAIYPRTYTSLLTSDLIWITTLESL
jgi:hypothetical protein